MSEKEYQVNRINFMSENSIKHVSEFLDSVCIVKMKEMIPK